MTRATPISRLSKLLFVLPIALAASSTATANDGLAGKSIQPLEAPMPAAQLLETVFGDETFLAFQTEASDQETTEASQEDQSEKTKADKRADKRADKKDKAAGKHDRDERRRGRPSVEVNVIVNVVNVNVNVKSGNEVEMAGQALRQGRDQLRRQRSSRDDRSEIDRQDDGARDGNAQIERLQRELSALREQLESTSGRDRAERRRDLRGRFDRMREEAMQRLGQMRERRRERDQRAQQQDAETGEAAAEAVEQETPDAEAPSEAPEEVTEEAPEEAAEEEAAEEEAAGDSDASATTDEANPPQASFLHLEAVEFVTSLFD